MVGLFLAVAVNAQSLKPSEVPLRKDGITVKRMRPTDQVAPVVDKNRRSLFSQKKRKKDVYKFRVTTCPSF